MGNCTKPEKRGVKGLERTYIKSYQIYNGTSFLLYTDFGLYLADDVLGERFINVRIHEVGEYQTSVLIDGLKYDIGFGLEIMHKNGWQWTGKAEQRAWTLKVGALIDGSSFTLQINGQPVEELPQTKLKLTGTGKNLDQACGIGGNIRLNQMSWTSENQPKIWSPNTFKMFRDKEVGEQNPIETIKLECLAASNEVINELFSQLASFIADGNLKNFYIRQIIGDFGEIDMPVIEELLKGMQNLERLQI